MGRRCLALEYFEHPRYAFEAQQIISVEGISSRSTNQLPLRLLPVRWYLDLQLRGLLCAVDNGTFMC